MKSICENCSNYIFDDENDCYCCNADLDEDDMFRFFTMQTNNCPYFSFYDEYGIVRKQNWGIIMINVYIVVSAALIPILNNYFEILFKPYSWWLAPTLMLAFIITFLIIQFLTLIFMVLFTRYKKTYNKSNKFFRYLIK